MWHQSQSLWNIIDNLSDKMTVKYAYTSIVVGVLLGRHIVSDNEMHKIYYLKYK